MPVPICRLWTLLQARAAIASSYEPWAFVRREALQELTTALLPLRAHSFMLSLDYESSLEPAPVVAPTATPAIPPTSGDLADTRTRWWSESAADEPTSASSQMRWVLAKEQEALGGSASPTLSATSTKSKSVAWAPNPAA